MDSSLAAGLPLDGSYVELSNQMNVMGAMHGAMSGGMAVSAWELETGLLDYATPGMLEQASVVQTAFPGSSPTDTFLSESQLEVVSIPSSGSVLLSYGDGLI